MSPVERVWWAAHGAPWFPGWGVFQCVAVLLGATLLARSTRALVVPYVVGVSLAAVGAIVLGSGAEWAAFVMRGARGRVPELEIAGFGALAGLVLGHALAARARGFGAARALDVLAPALGAMIACARLGCFFAGCDFGAPTDAGWALRYPTFTPAFRAQVDAGLLDPTALRTLPVHPTQLYEVGVGLVVLGVALALKAPRRAGDRFAAAVATYALGRLVVDVFRGDLVHGGLLAMTTTQGLALALLGSLVAWRSGAFGAITPSQT